MVHEDADGNRLATSTLEQDWWGDYYVKTEQTQYAHEQAEAERKKKCEPETRKDNADDDAGIVIKVLSAIIMVPVAIFVCLVIGAICLNIVGIAAVTIWPFVIMGPLNMIIGVVPIGLLFFVLGGIVLSYFPYIGILLYRRWKKEIAWTIRISICCAGLSSALLHTGGFCARKRKKPRNIIPIVLMNCRSGSARPAKTAYLLQVSFVLNAELLGRRNQAPLQCFVSTAANRSFPLPGRKRSAFCRECGKPYNLEEN